MLMRARRIRGGKGASRAVVCSSPISFLGGVDPLDGRIQDPDCGSRGESISGRIFCFPFGKGSTVGSYSMYQLRLNGHAPAAIVNSSAEPIVATGAIIADIPMVDGVDIGLLRTGDEMVVDADEGTVDISSVTERHVVTSIVRSRDRILLLCRSEKVGSYKGLWAGVSGFIQPREGAEEAARRELQEEIGMDQPSITRSTEPQMFRDGDTIWCVHPFLIDAKDPVIKTDWEHRSFEWVALEELDGYKTVPGLQQVIRSLLGR